MVFGVYQGHGCDRGRSPGEPADGPLFSAKLLNAWAS